MMKIAKWLADSTRFLEAGNVPTARLDCLVFLGDVTGQDRVHLLTHPEMQLTAKQLETLQSQLDQRLKHIPVAFIRGKTEFYGRDFVINDQVLEPRPESETMIEQLLNLPKPANIIDVGTGSGALAITAGMEVPGANIHAIDIDPACLAVAEKNAGKHNLDIHIYKGDLLAPVADLKLTDAVVLANLPYVPDDYRINRAAMNEPRLAIFGGSDGLDLYRRLFDQAEQSEAPLNYILTESLPFQHSDLRKIASQHGYHQIHEDDFIQVFSISASITGSERPQA